MELYIIDSEISGIFCFWLTELIITELKHFWAVSTSSGWTTHEPSNPKLAQGSISFIT
jgi:hypothetical protein